MITNAVDEENHEDSKYLKLKHDQRQWDRKKTISSLHSSFYYFDFSVFIFLASYFSQTISISHVKFSSKISFAWFFSNQMNQQWSKYFYLNFSFLLAFSFFFYLLCFLLFESHENLFALVVQAESSRPN